MLEYLKTENNKTYTENEATTLKTTGSDVLDLFSTIGTSRYWDEKEVIDRFIRAYSEDSDLAVKLLFHARDVRGGLGERRVFRLILAWLADLAPKAVLKNMAYIPEFGRYDDLLCLLEGKCKKETIHHLKEQLDMDIQALKNGQPVSLLAKWLPSINTSNEKAVKNAKILANAFHMTQEEYRKTLSALRKEIKLVENYLREMDYTFDYEKVPSRAHFKYRKAFTRNDEDRYLKFITDVNVGKLTMHAGNMAPYELVEAYLNRQDTMGDKEKMVLNTMWDSLPDYVGDENAIAVVDTSGSMYWSGRPTPASVALSLGMYFAERNKGVFQNHFIEFSESPQLIEIKGKTFVDKLQYLQTFNVIADTNLEAVFDLILDTAIKYKVDQKDLPSRLVIISDMEFNGCVKNANLTNFENAKKKFTGAGYQLPNIVFWNVASRNRQQPVTMNEEGVALVSGVSTHVFEQVMNNNLSNEMAPEEKISPYQHMLNVLLSDRYACISA